MDADAARMFLNQAMHVALPYLFHMRRLWVPRQKQLVEAVFEQDPVAGQLARRFYCESLAASAYDIAADLVHHLGADVRFFEWESDRQTVALADAVEQ